MKQTKQGVRDLSCLGPIKSRGKKPDKDYEALVHGRMPDCQHNRTYPIEESYGLQTFDTDRSRCLDCGEEVMAK